jgi:hypothetical protein
LLFTVALVHRCKVLAQASPPHAVCRSKAFDLPFTLATKPCFDLLHLAIWLHVMSHIQWAHSSHVWPLQTYPSHFYPHGSSCSH